MQKVNYIGSNRLTDNELQLFNFLFGLLYYSDPDYTIRICKKEDEIIAHIQSSKQEYRQDIINNLLFINKHLGVKVKFSSSLAISKLISFTINLENKKIELPL